MMTRLRFKWRLRTQSLELGERTVLMGIVNVTPDSFSDGGAYFATDAALAQSLRLLDEGADILDLGGESTRPDATPVTSEDEQARILPVLMAILKARPEAIVSVDTYHAETAQAAITLGAEIVNDVSGLLWDDRMAEILSQGKPGAVLMHTRGTPHEWGKLPLLRSAEIVPLVRSGLAGTLALAQQAGIAHEAIVIDPGFGFGKLGGANHTLLAHLSELHDLGYPLLTGTSRKRFLTAGLAQATEADRLHATIASNVACILAGSHILRVHDVAAARTASFVADAILNAH